MSSDGIAEQNAIIAHASALVGGRIFSSMPEEATLPIDPGTGLIRPYIVITFGQSVPSGTDRSIEGEAAQPLIMPPRFECWAADYDQARIVAGAVRTRFIGYAPTEGSSEMRLGRGYSLNNQDSTGRPTRFVELVAFELIYNLSHTDA